MRSINPLYPFLAFIAAGLALHIAALPGALSLTRAAVDAGPESSVTMYCAAALRRPVEALARRYEQEHRVRIEVQYGGSNTLLSQLKLAGQGDLFLAADDFYLTQAQQAGLVDQVVPIASMHAVVGLPRNSKVEVSALADLLGLRLALGNPDQAAIGQSLRAALTATGLWDQLDARVRAAGVYKPTVGEVANDIEIGSVDAGVLWDAVAAQHPGIRTVELPELAGVRAAVAVGVLRCSQQPDAALAFAEYLAASGHGAQVFQQMGYTPAAPTR